MLNGAKSRSQSGTNNEFNQDNTPCEYSKITENIFIGTNKCCQSKFAEELVREGITADISLEAERVDTPFGADFFVWIPVKDKTPPTKDEFKLGVWVLDGLIKMNRKVYVHCWLGHGRSPAMVAAYFISKGMTTEKAIEKIKKKRPSIILEKNQIKALKEFENTIK